MYQRQPTIYIGYDDREHLAFETLAEMHQNNYFPKEVDEKEENESA